MRSKGKRVRLVCAAISVPLITSCLTSGARAQPPFGALASEYDRLTGDFEWIRLGSGEWLEGEIDLLRDESLAFESDELGELELDWEDVAEIYSARRNTCYFEDAVVAIGTSGVTGSGFRPTPHLEVRWCEFQPGPGPGPT